jgi:hypothetical protein
MLYVGQANGVAILIDILQLNPSARLPSRIPTVAVQLDGVLSDKCTPPHGLNGTQMSLQGAPLPGTAYLDERNSNADVTFYAVPYDVGLAELQRWYRSLDTSHPFGGWVWRGLREATMPLGNKQAGWCWTKGGKELLLYLGTYAEGTKPFIAINVVNAAQC